MSTDAYPEWPCPYCGHEAWSELFAKPMRRCERLNPVICGHCNVLFNANWVDGCWMGRMTEAEWPGSLADFVEMKAEALRLELS
ncbi:MAG TPA: hypothetical protein PKN52_07870 [Trueperaceae bacterium]|nr:hypothetical protein [Trueperaceae bacterium]